MLYRSVELEKGWYRNASGPMVGRRKKDGLPVVLLPSGFAGYAYRDPETGKKVHLNSRTESLLETEALCFYVLFYIIASSGLSSLPVSIASAHSLSFLNSEFFFIIRDGIEIVPATKR